MSQDVAMTSTETVTSKDGTTIAFERSGSGPALVLVDGAMCSREFGPGRAVATELAGSYTVFVYDRRGRGDSGNTEPYSVQAEIDDLAAVIEAAGGDAFVMGQSSGAAIALLAAASGVPMLKVAAYEAPYVGIGDVDHVARIKELVAEGKPGKVVGYFMVTMVGGPGLLPVVLRMMPKVWKQLVAMAPTVSNDATIMGDWVAPKDRFAKITIPALVMGGTKAKPNMKKAVTDVAAAVPGSSLHWLAKQTHAVSPAVIADEARRFFTS